MADGSSVLRVLMCVSGHRQKTLAELADPDDMPDDLRAVHAEGTPGGFALFETCL